jgi:N-acetylglutamate synthase-like GNAT family acetyltransferase
MENRARAMGVQKLFVLTTRTAHWFIKRGFVPATVDACRRTASACTTGSANPRF